MHCVPPRCSTESCTRSAGAPPRCQWLVSCSVYIAAARPMDSSSARVGIQFKSLPRRRKVISKFTCVVVPTTGTSSTSTTCPRSVSEDTGPLAEKCGAPWALGLSCLAASRLRAGNLAAGFHHAVYELPALRLSTLAGRPSARLVPGSRERSVRRQTAVPYASTCACTRRS